MTLKGSHDINTLTLNELSTRYKNSKQSAVGHKTHFTKMEMEKKRKCNTNARDIKRRLEVIKAKMDDLNELGVPCAFTYVSHWSQGLFVIGDDRITPVIQDHAGEILNGLNSTGTASPNQNLSLPALPGPLYHLNYRTLQSIVTAVAKDLEVHWNGEVPEWWPASVVFSNPRKLPSSSDSKSL